MIQKDIDLNSYATLINNKIVIPSSSSNYVAVSMHFFMDLMKETIEKIALDEEWYLGHYQDVRKAIAAGAVESALSHYVRFGFFEHRMPYRITVDEDWYLASYPDVQSAIGERAYPSGQAHFDEVGYAEGRLPYPNFVLRGLGAQKPAKALQSTR